MKTWLKGGLIGISIQLIIFLIGGLIFGKLLKIMGLYIISMFLSMPGGLICKNCSFSIILILSLIIYFIIGALIGLIIQKGGKENE